MRLPVRVLVVAGVATVAIVGGGVLALGGSDEPGGSGGSGGPGGSGEPEFTTTPLASYDTASATVGRAPFCDSIDDRVVDAVLGEVPDALTWENGDEVDLGPGRPDVVHEFGCSYAVPDVGEARAWVFAPPVDAGRARRLVEKAARVGWCTRGDEPPFGNPTLRLDCLRGNEYTTSYRGLFGDAWLTCELTLTGPDPAGPPPDLEEYADRAGRWCVGVLEAVALIRSAGG